jgi:protein NRD1
MEALANIARQNVTAAPGNPNVPAPSNPYNMPPSQPAGLAALLGQHAPPPSATAAAPYASAPQSVNVPGMPFAFPQPGQHQGQPAVPPTIPPVTASSQAAGFLGVAPGAAHAPPAAGLDPNVQQQVMLIQLLASQGVPLDKIPAIVAGMQNNNAAAPPPTVPTPQPGHAPQHGGGWGQDGFGTGDSRDRPEYGNVRSPGRYNRRSRSRSPARHWESRDSPRGRNGRDFGGYGRDSPDRDHRGKGQDYRQRSPPGRWGRSHTPPHSHGPPATKWVEFDASLPSGHIRGTYSRRGTHDSSLTMSYSTEQNVVCGRRHVSISGYLTRQELLIGMCRCSEAELRSIFARHGRVQTCIVNKDKRHAFVKMETRQDAVKAKEAMENGPFRVSKHNSI